MAGAPESKDGAALRERLGSRPIALIGLMGAGKTTVGRRLARLLQLPFRDADAEIEKAAQMSIPEIFESYGEPEFRALERRVVARLAQNGAKVLATGGGAYMSDETRSLLRERAVTVWLKADIDILMERVARRSTRPLLKAPDPRKVMEELMSVRYPVYAEADITVESRNVRREVIAQDILDALEGHLSGGGRP